jgi:hypothetical protein
MRDDARTTDEAMKKVLVHVGYPKAASTTLQNGLFLDLHKQKLINFLGRAFESRYFGALDSKSKFKGWFKAVIKDRHDLDPPAPLSDSLVNVLSEGLFMMNERHGAGFMTPGQLRSYFSSRADQLDVLLVLRAQSNLVPSYYVQNYRRFQQTTFEAFVEYNSARQWAGEGKVFNFRDVARAFAATLGKQHVHLLLFEDFVQDRPYFSTALGEIMQLPRERILANLGEGHMNRTPREEGVLLVRKLDKRSWRHHAIKLLGRFNLGESLKIKLPPISAEQKQAIFEVFKGSNEELAAEFSLDRERMRRYRYF